MVVVIGSIAPREVITIHIRARLNQLAQPPVGHNSATLSTSSTTDDPTNNTASVEFGILSNCIPSIATEIPIPPELPHTGAPEGPTGSGLPLALLGLLLMVIGLSIRRRNAADR